MAADGSLAGDSVTDALTCTTCLEPFLDPCTVVPCGHSFCFDCVRMMYKHQVIKCPYDKVQHHQSPESLPVNYQVLTALPMGVTNESKNSNDGGEKVTVLSTIRYCEMHPQKKVKFYCKNDR